jgi:hypothetical protein
VVTTNDILQRGFNIVATFLVGDKIQYLCTPKKLRPALGGDLATLNLRQKAMVKP